MTWYADLVGDLSSATLHETGGMVIVCDVGDKPEYGYWGAG